MDTFSIPLLIAVLCFAAIVLAAPDGEAKSAAFMKKRKFPLSEQDALQSEAFSGEPQTGGLYCRVRLTEQETDDSGCNVLCVEICGTLQAPADTRRVAIRLELSDITDQAKSMPVHARIRQWQRKDSPLFVYNAELGKLPNTQSTLSDWLTVAKLDADKLLLPRKGQRNLCLNASILSHESGEQFARTGCVFCYENTEFGYLDIEENILRAKTLAVPLAFAVGAADNNLLDCKVELIKKWTKDSIDISHSTGRAGSKLDKALNKTVSFFRAGKKIDCCKICKGIAQIVPLGQRYEILELCLRVAQADGKADQQEVALLKKFATWLQVDMERFQSMMEKILPVGIHESEDAQTILGVTSDMDKEQTRQLLNKEYRKWNARVTSSDSDIQTQADQMLKIIAEARREYIA